MHESWLEVLGDELEQPYMRELRAFLLEEVAAGRGFYPPADRVFNALSLTPFDDVRVVVLGQDPYHGRGQAMGLCFSVPPGVPAPPSLQNIHKELASDLGLATPSSGDLTPWAERGVLLLNAVLTVSPGKPASHAGKGWEQFTDRAIRELSDRREGIVFLLWGRYAQQKGAVVDPARHHVLTAPHPSPYSAANGRLAADGRGELHPALPANPEDVRAQPPHLAVQPEQRHVVHVPQRDASIGRVDRPVQELVARRHRDQRPSPPVLVAGEARHRLREQERQAGREERLAPDGRERAAPLLPHRVRPHCAAVEQRTEVVPPALDQPRDRPPPVQLLARRRRDRVAEVDREHLEQARRDEAGVAERVGVRHVSGPDEAQSQTGGELGRCDVAERTCGRGDELHMVVDQLRPLAGVGTGTERADVPEPERRPAAILDPVGIDVHVPPDGGERPCDEPPELVRLRQREVRQVLVVGRRSASFEEFHGRLHTVTALALVAKPPSE